MTKKPNMPESRVPMFQRDVPSATYGILQQPFRIAIALQCNEHIFELSFD